MKIRVEQACNEPNIDEVCSFVGKKSNQRRLYTRSAIKQIRSLLIFLENEKNSFSKSLKDHLAPFGITRFYIDNGGTYERHIDSSAHEIAKHNTQKIERKTSTLEVELCD